MPQKLEVIQAGNPILYDVARRLTPKEIKSSEIQQLITDIRYTNQVKKSGIGLAAPQVGKSIALSVIGIKATPNRPELEPLDMVIINPEYDGIGERLPMWEACQSGAKGALFAQAMRFKAIQATWLDEAAVRHNEKIDGFVAHVFQHETDHLNGVLFFERVENPRSYITVKEYRKRISGEK